MTQPISRRVVVRHETQGVAVSNVRNLAADIIEPFIRGDFKRRERAEGHAASLDYSGRLRGGKARPDIRERVVYDLQFVMDPPVAEKVAAALDDAGLLAR